MVIYLFAAVLDLHIDLFCWVHNIKIITDFFLPIPTVGWLTNWQIPWNECISMSLVPYSSQLLQARRCICKYYIEGFQIMKIGMFKRLKYCKQAYVYLWKHACIFSFKRRKISIDPKLMESILFLKARFFLWDRSAWA